jgi:hypothetical protein
MFHHVRSQTFGCLLTVGSCRRPMYSCGAHADRPGSNVDTKHRIALRCMQGVRLCCILEHDLRIPIHDRLDSNLHYLPTAEKSSPSHHE